MRNKIKQFIEDMPHAAYIFLKSVLALTVLMLLFSCLLFAFCGKSLILRHLAVQQLEAPAGILLLGLFGFSILLDRR